MCAHNVTWGAYNSKVWTFAVLTPCRTCFYDKNSFLWLNLDSDHFHRFFEFRAKCATFDPQVDVFDFLCFWNVAQHYENKDQVSSLKAATFFCLELANLSQSGSTLTRATETSFCCRKTCDTALEPPRSILLSHEHPQVCAHIRHTALLKNMFFWWFLSYHRISCLATTPSLATPSCFLNSRKWKLATPLLVEIHVGISQFDTTHNEYQPQILV